MKYLLENIEFFISVEKWEADSTNDPELDETICYEINFSDSDDSDDQSGPLFPSNNTDVESEVKV